MLTFFRVFFLVCVCLCGTQSFAGFLSIWKTEATVKVVEDSQFDQTLLKVVEDPKLREHIDSFQYLHLAKNRRVEIEAEIKKTQDKIEKIKKELLALSPLRDSALLAPVKHSKRVLDYFASKVMAAKSLKGEAADRERKRLIAEADQLQARLVELRYGDKKELKGLKGLGKEYNQARVDSHFLEFSAMRDLQKILKCAGLSKEQLPMSAEAFKKFATPCAAKIKMEKIDYDLYVKDPILLERIHKVNFAHLGSHEDCANCRDRGASDSAIQVVKADLDGIIQSVQPRRVRSMPALRDDAGEDQLDIDSLTSSDPQEMQDLIDELQDDEVYSQSESVDLLQTLSPSSSEDAKTTLKTKKLPSLSVVAKSSVDRAVSSKRNPKIAKKIDDAVVEKIAQLLGVKPSRFKQLVQEQSEEKSSHSNKSSDSLLTSITPQDEQEEILKIIGVKPKGFSTPGSKQAARAIKSQFTVHDANLAFFQGYSAIEQAHILMSADAMSFQFIKPLQQLDAALKQFKQMQGKTLLDPQVEQAFISGLTQEREAIITHWLARFKEEEQVQQAEKTVSQPVLSKPLVAGSKTVSAVLSESTTSPSVIKLHHLAPPELKMLPVRASAYARIAWLQDGLEKIKSESEKVKAAIASHEMNPKKWSDFKKEIDLFQSQVKTTQQKMSREVRSKDQEFKHENMFKELDQHIREAQLLADEHVL